MSIQELILHEDSLFWVLNKPANIHSSNSGRSTHSLSALILENFPEQKTVNEEGGLVQRLDFETSGCLLVARSKAVWELLHTQLTSGIIKKSYLALVEGSAAATTIESLIGSRYRGSKKVTLYPIEKSVKRALPATTAFNPLGNPSADQTLIEAQTFTGRRHQVRAHAAHAGFPLVGDTLYGSTMVLKDCMTTNAPEFFLHAHSLTMKHPESMEPISFKAVLPDYATFLAQYLPRP